MARNTPKSVGVFIVDLSGNKMPTPIIDLRGGSSPEPQRRWIELDVFDNSHLGSQSVEPRRQRLIIFEDEAKKHESEIAIHRLSTRGVRERHGTYGAFELVAPAILAKERGPCGQARTVGQQVAKSDLRPILASPLADISVDRVVESDASAFRLLYDDWGSRENFGQRSEIEDRVIADVRRRIIERAGSKRLAPERVRRVTHLDDSARKRPGVDGLRNYTGCGNEPGGMVHVAAQPLSLPLP
jgi:hypothetical protein